VTKRVVRVTLDLFRALDVQLPYERGPNGEATRAEFAASDLTGPGDVGDEDDPDGEAGPDE
jgi:hypothetical protein